VRRASTSIVGFGIVAALFLAIMSTFYLQHIPNQGDLDRLETDLRNDYGLYLSATHALEMTLHPPPGGTGRLSLEVICTLRADLRKRPSSVRLYLDRIAASILDHPDLRGRIAFVSVAHAPPLEIRTTHWPEESTPAP
jgi:hypothetical protein